MSAPVLPDDLWGDILQLSINLVDYKDLLLFQEALAQSAPDCLCRALKLTVLESFPDYLRLDTFSRLCNKESLQQAEWLLSRRPNFVTSDQAYSVFKDACAKGKLHLAKWLSRRYPLCGSTHLPLQMACANGHESIVRWLMGGAMNRDETIIGLALQEWILRLTCRSGHLHICRYLLQELQWLRDMSMDRKETVYSEIIQDVCFSGHLELAQWLHEFSGIHLQDKTPNVLLVDHVAAKGHLEMMQWLDSQFNLAAVVEDANHLLCCAGISGNLALVQWLVRRYRVDDVPESVFRVLCCQRQGHIVQWLVECLKLRPNKHKVLLEKLFYMACGRGSLALSQFLAAMLENGSSRSGSSSSRSGYAESKGDDTPSDNHRLKPAFLETCYHGCVETAKWMVEYFGISKDTMSTATLQQCLGLAASTGSVETAQWLVQYFEMDLSGMDWQGVMRNLINPGAFPWLVDYFNISLLECVQSKAVSIFLCMCQMGNLRFVKWFKTRFGLPEYQASIGFRDACRVGNLEIAQWLVQNCTFEPHHWGSILLDAVYRNDLPMAYWLMTCFPGEFRKDRANIIKSLDVCQDPVLRNWIVHFLRMSADDQLFPAKESESMLI